MLLSIIIISYNTSDLTEAAVQSVIAEISASERLKNQSEIIVIDNNSSDKSVAVLKKLQSSNPSVTMELIANAENVGFAKANNQGLRQAKGEYLFLLNSDTEIQRGALENLIRSFEKTVNNEGTAVLASHHQELDRLGILAATLLNPDMTLQPQGGSLPNLKTVTAQMLLIDDLPLIGRFVASTQNTGKHQLISDSSKLRQQGWVGGTAMMIKRAVLDEIGLLDENIFMYGEDMEFCLRAQAHHWDVAITPQARVIHIGSASSSSENALIGEIKSYVYLWSKHLPSWQLPLVKGILRLGCLLRMAIFGTILGNKEKAKAYHHALQAI